MAWCFVLALFTELKKTIKRERKRPRTTVKNKNHINKIWGDNGKVEVYIPTLIDDYNHWMCGVDIVDQRIAYYHPNLRCHRNWMPIFLQLCSMMRNNGFIVHNSDCGKSAKSHKMFTMEWVRLLLAKAHAHHIVSSSAFPSNPLAPPTPTRSKRPLTETKPASRKRCRMSNLESMLSDFPERLRMPRNLHQPMKKDQKSNGACVWCSAFYNKKKKSNTALLWDKEVCRTKTICSFCSEQNKKYTHCFLCSEHFRQFHDHM